MPMGSQVPAKMKTAVMRALSKNAAQRQQTVTEFYEDLSIGAGRPAGMSGPRSMVASSHPDVGGPSGTGYLPVSQDPVIGAYPYPSGSFPVQPSVGISPKKSNAGIVVVIIGFVVVACGIGGFLLYRASGGGGDNDTPATKACKAVIQASREGNVIAATNQFHACSGPSKDAAEKAVDAAAKRAVSRSGCTAVEDAKAADKIGLPAALNELKGKKPPCHGL
jgi:hypothetical protein